MSDLLKGIGPANAEALSSLQPTKLEQGQGLRANHPKSAGEIKHAAEDFEGLLLQQMFKSMWSNVPEGGLLSGSREEGMYKDMFQEALAKNISKGQGIGIKGIIEKELTKAEGQRVNEKNKN